MNISIKSKTEDIFKKYLHLINPILGKSKLTNNEIEVYSRLLLIQHLYKNLTVEQLSIVSFNKETKKRIRTSIKEESGLFLSEATYNNIILSLRKKKLIEGNFIKHKPEFSGDSLVITYKLELND